MAYNKHAHAIVHHWGAGGGGSHYHMAGSRQFNKGNKVRAPPDPTQSDLRRISPTIRSQADLAHNQISGGSRPIRYRLQIAAQIWRYSLSWPSAPFTDGHSQRVIHRGRSARVVPHPSPTHRSPPHPLQVKGAILRHSKQGAKMQARGHQHTSPRATVVLWSPTHLPLPAHAPSPRARRASYPVPSPPLPGGAHAPIMLTLDFRPDRRRARRHGPRR